MCQEKFLEKQDTPRGESSARHSRMQSEEKKTHMDGMCNGLESVLERCSEAICWVGLGTVWEPSVWVKRHGSDLVSVLERCRRAREPQTVFLDRSGRGLGAVWARSGSGLEDGSGLRSGGWERSGIGAVWDPEFGPEKVRKMDALRATSKSIFAQLCRQVPFSDDGWGWIFPGRLRRDGSWKVFRLLSLVFSLKQDTPSGGDKYTERKEIHSHWELPKVL